MTSTYDPPEPNGALVVGPDDHLVISLPEEIAVEDVERFDELVRERFGDRVTVLSGIDQMAVLRNGAPEATR